MEDKEDSRFIDIIELTVNKNPKSPPLSKAKRCCVLIGGKMGIFQLILFIAQVLAANAIDPILFGMGFLTRDPNEFECLVDDKWVICSKEDICDKQIGLDSYRPVKDDEYLDNWERPEKLDLLCEPKWKIGLLGSIFFVGVVATTLVYPILADQCFGRKPVILFVFFVSIVG